jgi:hypothetical protein
MHELATLFEVCLDCSSQPGCFAGGLATVALGVVAIVVSHSSRGVRVPGVVMPFHNTVHAEYLIAFFVAGTWHVSLTDE